jgi:[glutamine synthetase] adenylyltransferase / [glutamine synthetase]-adenylyl-L-tyrosine phosphorylase
LVTLAERIQNAPIAHDSAAVERCVASFKAKAPVETHHSLELGTPIGDLIIGIFGSSPYLSSLILADPAELANCLATQPEDYLREIGERLTNAIATARRHDEAMKPLRQAKRRLALMTALTDLGGVWGVKEVTRALSEGADMLVSAAVRFLLGEAARHGRLMPADPAAPENGSGYIVLGMGKHGAYELNYSSDIDLIVFYDPQKAPLAPDIEPGKFFVRLTRDLVKLMTERTSDGYVFRTDLRLRPDPGATQVALSVNAALHYYETFGQNWERAAYIKARPVAGDIQAGEDLLRALAPYIWRKYLDYAAIADIHAMKRQIHAYKGHAQVAVEGHNLKLGRGGIREIEFFVQTQQLIAGGRQVDLRVRGTLAALDGLVARQWIAAATAAQLGEAYYFLRGIEHRLQMINDEQTHSMPLAGPKFEQVAHFSGYADGVALSVALRQRLETVERHYAALFENIPELSREGGHGNLVFTGDDDDPETIKTLSSMGFSSPAGVISIVRGWHFGRYPAMRSARARESLTEFTPQLLEALARTAQPDLALGTFDRFFAELPAGVQLFALLRTNPNLLLILADIMGTAPRLARIVSRRARLMDAVLDPGFLGTLPTDDALAAIVESALDRSRSYEDCLDHARAVGNEQAFLIGVRVLSGTVAADAAGWAYASLAERLISGLQEHVEELMRCQHGVVAGGQMVVIGMGKLGGHEMTANSDLDLIIIYDPDGADIMSDGVKAVSGSQYYARQTQRLISALSAPTAEGQLYAVDMRLRPSGKAGPVATSLSSFIAYQNCDAWTWEHLALTRARVVSGPPALRQKVEQVIADVLCQPRDRAKIAADVRDMRRRIAEEKGAQDIWDIKNAHGGLIDVEFIAQFLQLVHAHELPGVLDQNTTGAFIKLRDNGVLSAGESELLLQATNLYHSVTQVLRLCLDERFNPRTAPEGLKALVSRACNVAEFSQVEALLVRKLASVRELFDRLVR